MNCNEFKAMLDGFIDGELDGDRQLIFMDHAANCPDCARELEAAKTLRELMADMREAPVPLKAQAAWREAVRAEGRRRAGKRLWKYACMAAALVLVLGGVFMLAEKKPENVIRETAALGVIAATDDPASFIATDGASSADMAQADYDALEKLAVKDVDEAAGALEELCREYGAKYSIDSGKREATFRITIDGALFDEFLDSVRTVGRETSALRGELGGGKVVFHVQLTEE